MTDDRAPFREARLAGKAIHQQQRLAKALADRIRASRYTSANGDGDLTVYAEDVSGLAAEILASFVRDAEMGARNA